MGTAGVVTGIGVVAAGMRDVTAGIRVVTTAGGALVPGRVGTGAPDTGTALTLALTEVALGVPA